MTMSHRNTVRLCIGVVLAVALTACSGQVRDPTEYGDANDEGKGYYGNLMYGCTGVLPDENGNYEDPSLESQNFCRCVFDGLKETVPWADAKAFDEAQAKAEPGELAVPSNINTVQERCAAEE